MVNHALVLSFTEECMQRLTARNTSACIYLLILFRLYSCARRFMILSKQELVNVGIYQKGNALLRQCVYKLMQIFRAAERRSWRSLLLIVSEGKNGKVGGREQQIERKEKKKEIIKKLITVKAQCPGYVSCCVWMIFLCRQLCMALFLESL